MGNRGTSAVSSQIQTGVLSLSNPVAATRDNRVAFALENGGGTFYLEIGRKRRPNQMMMLDETNAEGEIARLREEFGDDIDPDLGKKIVRSIERWTRENPGTMDDLMDTSINNALKWWGVDPSKYGKEFWLTTKDIPDLSARRHDLVIKANPRDIGKVFEKHSNFRGVSELEGKKYMVFEILKKD